MKKVRVIATVVVTVAGILMAAPLGTYPHWFRSTITGVLLLGAAIGIPAMPSISAAMAKRDVPGAADAIERAQNGTVDG